MSHHDCSGCGLCLLVCPVWRESRDVRLTPKGRARAIQHGATRDDLAASVAGCTLCGACEPACPEELPLVDMLLELRSGGAFPQVPGQRSAGAVDAFVAKYDAGGAQIWMRQFGTAGVHGRWFAHQHRATRTRAQPRQRRTGTC